MPLLFSKKLKPTLPDIRKALHQHLAGYQPGRPASRLHASDVTKQDPEFCPRSQALRALAKKVPDEFLTTADVLTFGLGNTIQDTVTEWFADLKMAVGDWKCSHCGSLYTFQKRPAKCETVGCGGKRFEYKEIRVTSPLTLVSCGLDILLDVGIGKHVLVEHKTMVSTEFKKLVAPLGEHRLRTALYLETIAEAVNDPRMASVHKAEAYIMYTTKGGWGSQEPEIAKWGFADGPFSPFKVYVQKRDPVLVAPYASRAKEYKLWKDGGPMPDRICLNSFEPRAKQCKQMVPCFSGKF